LPWISGRGYFFAVADRLPTGDHEGFLPLSVACARVYFVLTGRMPPNTGNGEWDAQLDTVALSLSVVARIYATDPLTNILFPLSEAELLRGNFQGGAKLLAHDGKERYTGLHVAVADLENAIRILTAATMPRPADPPPTRA
jgi:hypothetical protein